MASKKTADESKTYGDGEVALKLAHPFAPHFAKRVGIETETDLEVGDTVKVSKDDARAMIDSGLVQVDPFDTEAVAKVLDIPEQEALAASGAQQPSSQTSATPPTGQSANS